MESITEFFETSVGKWFSQRTGHDLQALKSSVGKAELFVDAIDAAAPETKALCDRFRVDAAEVLGGIKLRWEATIAASPKKEFGSAAIVALRSADGKTGTVLASTGAPNRPGAYAIGEDGALTLTIPTETGAIEERVWYAMPNLRFRTSTVAVDGQPAIASFCSEIRSVAAPPKTEA
ncbi:MAG: phycobiliprotein lyase [Cyanophyceae cyanobacterium]